MEKLKKILENKLRNARRVAVLGIGSDLRGDDAAGMLVAKGLEVLGLKVFLGATSPENLTGEIIKFKPTHLLIIDAADFAIKPGMVKIIEKEEIGGVSFSTHRMPTNLLAEYLMRSIGCEILFIGIQPKELNFGSELSQEVQDSVKQLCEILGQAYLSSIREAKN